MVGLLDYFVGQNQFGVTNENSYRSQVKITAGNVAKTKMLRHELVWMILIVLRILRMVLSVMESWVDADSQPQAKAKAKAKAKCVVDFN